MQMLAIAAFAPSLAYNAALAPVVRPALAPRAVAPVAQLDQAAGFEKGMANFQVRRAAHAQHTNSRPPARRLQRLRPSIPSALERSRVLLAAAQPQADFPWLAKYGFGPTVKAERWNGDASWHPAPTPSPSLSPWPKPLPEP